MRKLIAALWVLGSCTVNGQMIIREADSLSKHYSSKANTYLVADSSLYSYYSIDLYSVSMYASPENKEKNIPETRIFWSELPIYKRIMNEESRQDSHQAILLKGSKPFGAAWQKKYARQETSENVISFNAKKPLAGYRIAIDPGHIANDTVTGKLEQKFISLNIPYGEDSLHVAFAEGQLTWQTAVALAARLRNAGAEVMFTRNGPTLTAFGLTFEEWKQKFYLGTLDSLLKVDPENQNYRDLKSGKLADDRSIFRFVFRDVELRKRAELINNFKPDISLIIHYNVDDTNSPWSHPTTKNNCMLFVPGAFQAGELNDADKRFDFLRLLLLDDIERSVNICTYVGEQFTKKLSVPLAKSVDAGYLSSSCRFAGNAGVYARNLSMTRLVQGPIVFGETLYQDNVEEALVLSQMNTIDPVSGQKASKRTIEVAEAYYEGLLQWAFSLNGK